jgi:hypothetical protein
MSLALNSNIVDIQKWLGKNLSDKKRIKACCKDVLEVPTNKGIYFWFVKKEGYKELSTFLPIKRDETAYSTKINGSIYDLVYLGTAGARNNSSGTNTGNLQERLKWHLCNTKNISALCNGTMSTYRRTLGALLASDLIDNDLQTKLDNFLCKYFYIYYVEYPGSFKDVKNVIDQDEDILIDILRPIFNLSKNPNAKNSAHLTGIIQKRRQLVERNSKEKHCNQVASDNTGKSSLAKIKIDTAAQMPGNNLCIEFKVKKNQNIAEVASGIIDLPIGPCSIELCSKNREIIKSYINGKIRTIRTEDRTVSQFFNAPDGNTPKWRLVQNEMNDKKKPIEIITVRVRAISRNYPKKSNSKKSKAPLNIADSALKIKRSKKFKVVMICSSRKNTSFFTQFPNIGFTNLPQTVHEKFPEDRVPGSKLTWREYLTTRQKESTLLQAYNLYKHPSYLQLYTKFQKNFFILSAGWGLVNSEFRLPNYNITFSNNGDPNAIRNNNPLAPPIYHDFNQMNESHEDIVFVGTPDYIPLFIELTKNLKCRKIIFWKKKNTPQKFALPNNTFKFEYYATKTNRNWHYQLAQDL